MQSKKVLIAEDELIIAKVYTNLLRSKNYEVKCVTTSTDAVSEAIRFRPDWILLDVYLKNNTCGIQAAKNIREAGINAPIIFTTGNSAATTKKEIENIKNVYLLTKPVEFYDIEKIICFG